MKFEDVKKIKTDEFLSHFNLFSEVMTGKVDPIKKPSSLPIRIQGDEIDEAINLRFTDVPFNKAMMAVKQNCGRDKGKFFSVITRIWALAEIFRNPPKRLGKWVYKEAGDLKVDDNLIEAAASAQIKSDGNFHIIESCLSP